MADGTPRVDGRQGPAVGRKGFSCEIGQVEDGDVGETPGSRHQHVAPHPPLHPGEHPADERSETVAHVADSVRIHVRSCRKEVDAPAQPDHGQDMLPHGMLRVRHRFSPRRHRFLGPGGIDEEGDHSPPGECHRLVEERIPASGPGVDVDDAGEAARPRRHHEVGGESPFGGGAVAQVMDGDAVSLFEEGLFDIEREFRVVVEESLQSFKGSVGGWRPG